MIYYHIQYNLADISNRTHLDLPNQHSVSNLKHYMLGHNSKYIRIAATYTDMRVNIKYKLECSRDQCFLCVFTSDCRTPSNTMISVIELSLVCDKVVRLQSKKSPRYFCFTSGRVMNLSHHVQKTR